MMEVNINIDFACVCGMCSVLVVEKVQYGGSFILLSVAGHISLFPLFYQPAGEITSYETRKCFILN